MDSSKLVVATIILMISGCADTTAVASECYDEVMTASTVREVSIDLEEIIPGLVGADSAESHWDNIVTINTACEAPPLLPDQFAYFVELNGQDAKPVALVRTKHLSGILFLYHSRGVEEVMTGLAGALVEYESNGNPRRIYKATELLGDEGWARFTRSRVSADSIQRCDQELEHFRYSPEGDIIGQLEEPIRRPLFCEDILFFSSVQGH